MMILTRKEDVRKQLKALKPSRIAVAYIGKDWQEYICPQDIDSIIVSPTIGSNPDAIVQLAEIVSYDRVFLLDRLHAKIYLGEDCALIGSFNLSRNGLGEGGLLELGNVVDQEKDLGILVG
jgi:hypothetical protein